MKRIILTTGISILAFSFFPNAVKAATDHKTEFAIDSVQIQINILKRLNEIKAMDMSALNRSEKKALKKEVRVSENKLRGINGGGVYISVGALIIIILLLIIIF